MEKDVAEEERTGIYDCEIPECPFSTNDWLKLAEHDAKHQDHFRFFLCEYCDKPNKKYKNEYEFKMHLASHADEFKFYSCYKCPGFQSRDVNDVLSHLAIEHNIHYHPEPNAEIFKTKNKKVEKILEVKSSRNKRKSGEDRDHPISHYVPYPEADPLNPFPPRKELTIKFSREIYNQVIREDLARQEIRSSTPKTMLDKSKSKRRPSADKTARAPASHAAKIKSDESSDEKEKVRSPSIEGEKKPRENEGEKEMEELDMGKLVSQALEGNFHILFKEISQIFSL